MTRHVSDVRRKNVSCVLLVWRGVHWSISQTNQPPCQGFSRETAPNISHLSSPAWQGGSEKFDGVQTSNSADYLIICCLSRRNIGWCWVLDAGCRVPDVRRDNTGAANGNLFVTTPSILAFQTHNEQKCYDTLKPIQCALKICCKT